jgi:hypothetical protein
MELIGRPFEIQNTADHGWLVTWTNAVRISDEPGNTIETVSFTVSIPHSAHLSIEDVQRYALKRAAELLVQQIRLTESGG